MNGYEIVNRIWCFFFGMAIGMAIGHLPAGREEEGQTELY